MKRYNKYKFNEFLCYFKGEMTGSERNSFEKEAQKDPFTEEALEGLETISPDNAEKDLEIIQSRLNRRVSGKRRIAAYRIAASIAVLMIISSVFIVVEKTNSLKQEPIPEYNTVTIDIAKSEPVYKPEEKEAAIPAQPSGSRISAEKAEKAQDRSYARADNEVQLQEPQQAKQEEMAAKKDVSIAVRQLPESEKIAAEGLSETRKAAVAGSRTATDSAVPAAYMSDDKNAAADYVPPQPLYGPEAFDKYISENLVRPDSATSGQRVVVVISFKVLTDGKIDSIKVIRSPGKQFSDEAIRLIRSGPAWKPAMRGDVAVEDEVRLRIVFP